MIVDNQLIEVKWHNSNKKWYESKGYTFTHVGDTIMVPPELLSKGSHSLVEFICDYCGEHFYLNMHAYYHGKHAYWGEYKCTKCYSQHIADYSLKFRQEDIYSKIESVCDKYAYKLLTKQNEIQTINTSISYVCPTHGIQKRRAHLFVYGDHICPECNKMNKRLSISDVIQRISDRGGVLLNPEEYAGSTVNNLSVICRECGKPFITSYNSFMCTRDGDGQRCASCSKKHSNGESKIANWLFEHHIVYVFQKTFDNCRDERPLPFDFYLPDYNMIIEYDGAQHFRPVLFHHSLEQFSDEEKALAYVQKHDAIKNQYCYDNSIELLRIGYYDYVRVGEKQPTGVGDN